jgi:hypothetical protein
MLCGGWKPGRRLRLTIRPRTGPQARRASGERKHPNIKRRLKLRRLFLLAGEVDAP